MAESYSVKAILSATDRGFSSTLKSCSSALDRIDSKISGFSFGLLAGAGQAAFGAISSGISGMVGEINDSNIAWKTFEGNMGILGKTDTEINKVKGTLQDFATKSIYSASDMASTYSQLASVGIDSADELVKGFGGLAAAAENPQQAMKTLSQQAVQMAAKPTVAWQDFKLMLEQSPAGISAVAKQMGMTTSELVTNIQEGTVSTTDFFDAIKQVAGTGSDFEKMATQYKSVGQAMDGLKESVAVKLSPAFDVFSNTAIGAISKVADSLDSLNAQKIADKVSSMLSKASKYVDAFKSAFSGVWKEVVDAGSAIKSSISDITGAFGSAKSVEGFKGIMESVAAGIKAVANFAKKHSGTIAKLITMLPKIVLALKGFQIARSVGTFIAPFAKGLGSIAASCGSGLASKLFGVAGGTESTGEAAKTSANGMLAAAKAFMMMGAGVLMVSVGFGILAAASISLANAGGLAIGVMAGLVVALAGLMVLAAVLAPALTAGAVGFLAFGAAILLVGAGALLAAAGLFVVSAALPAIVTYGLKGALAIAALGAGMAVFAAGALLAGAACVILGAGLVVLGAGLLVVGSGVLLLGAGMLILGTGALIAATALAIISAVLPIIASYGLMGAASIVALSTAMLVFSTVAGVAGVACAVLGAGILVLGAGMLVVAAAVLIFGAGMLLLATSALVASLALTAISAVLPTLSAYGLQGAMAIVMLSGAMLVFAAGAAAAGVAAVVLGAGLAVVAAGVALVAAGIVALGVSMVALAVGVAACAVSIAIAAGALALFNMALPSTIQNGVAAGAAMTELGAGMLVMGAGAVVAAAGLIALGLASAAAALGIAAFGIAMTASAVGVLAMAGALKNVNSSMKSISKNAKSTKKSLDSMKKSVKVVESGLEAMGNKAKSAMNKLTSAFDNSASKAQIAGKKVGTGFTKGMQTGLSQAPAIARMMVVSSCTALSSGYSSAYNSGRFIGIGFANGMLSMLGTIQNAAAKMADAADKAVRAKAKIGSPSRVAEKLGAWWGEGYGNGIYRMIDYAKTAAQNLVDIPNINVPNMQLAYAGDMSADYDYYRDYQYTIEVPVIVDGRETAKATAVYMQSELDKRQKRDSRKQGKA